MNEPHWLTKPLPFGRLYLHTSEYQEFLCSASTLTWLQEGGMRKMDGKDVYVVEKCEMTGGNVVGGYYFKDEGR